MLVYCKDCRKPNKNSTGTSSATGVVISICDNEMIMAPIATVLAISTRR